MAVSRGRKPMRRYMASTLYSHIARRPLSRAWPRVRRIPRRLSPWLCHNLDVGRGATTHVLFLHTTNAAIGTPSSQHHTPFPAASPVPLPPPPRATAENDSAYETTLAPEASPVEPRESEVHVDEEAEPSTPVEADTRAETVIETEIETKTESSASVTSTTSINSADGAATSPAQAVAEDMQHVVEPSEILTIRDQDTNVPLSRQVHIVGISSHARFVAHAVASTPDMPPIGIYVSHRKPLIGWGEEFRRLTLYDARNKPISSVGIPCPQQVRDIRSIPAHEKHETAPDQFLDNVIVDTEAAAIFPMMRNLSHRIDRHTTICLLHPGLGLMEAINKEIFTDPDQRPNFVLGHSTHRVTRVSSTMYSLKQRLSGTLYLHGATEFEGSTTADPAIAHERQCQTKHLVQLLSSTPTLNAIGLPLVRFLSWKLPWLIFCCAADAISVALGCRYKEIYHNPHARTMWDNILDETTFIVSQLPEIRDIPHRRDYFVSNALRRKMRTYLAAQNNNISPWVKHVRMGVMPPVHFFNGYVIQQAEALGLSHKHNSTAYNMVRARTRARRRELDRDMMGTTPYMMDGDHIGGGQPHPTLEDLLRLELEEL
ncbi:hypothetical protein F4808DRAFT_453364 [Astrocystis sublimbata]|nr:hypothetical protein F4808DRAFT_453364 [Astrocystis sublimbata]